MGNSSKNCSKGKRRQEDSVEKLAKYFDYLPEMERDKLLYGDEFVEVPEQELKRLRIDVYSYLM